MYLTFEPTGKITLDELKDLILSHIGKKPSHWLPLGTTVMIEEWIEEKQSIPELILFIR